MQYSDTMRTNLPKLLHTAGLDTIFVQIYMDPPPVLFVKKKKSDFLTPLGPLGADPYRFEQK